jgi:hypothetical protein
MSDTPTIEERLLHVEKDVADLKSRIEGLGSKGNWIDQITGSFKEDPGFDEILRLGREIRQAGGPGAE